MRRWGAFVLGGGVLFVSSAFAQTAVPTVTGATPIIPKPVTAVKAAPAMPIAAKPADLVTGAAAGQGAVSEPAGQRPTPAMAGKPAAKSDAIAKIATAGAAASKPAPKYTGPKVEIDVDLTAQEMHVVMPDRSTRDWKISSGRMGLDTPDGSFRVQRLDEQHKSKEYDGAPMPYAIFFDDHGHAIHGTYEHGFGVAHSHGCIRLPVKEAKELFEEVKIAGAEINIAGQVDPGAVAYDQAPRFSPESERSYREPVDPNEEGFDPWDQGAQAAENDDGSRLPVRSEPAVGMRPEPGTVGNPIWPDSSNY